MVMTPCAGYRESQDRPAGNADLVSGDIRDKTSRLALDDGLGCQGKETGGNKMLVVLLDTVVLVVMSQVQLASNCSWVQGKTSLMSQHSGGTVDSLT